MEVICGFGPDAQIVLVSLPRCSDTPHCWSFGVGALSTQLYSSKTQPQILSYIRKFSWITGFSFLLFFLAWFSSLALLLSSSCVCRQHLACSPLPLRSSFAVELTNCAVHLLQVDSGVCSYCHAAALLIPEHSPPQGETPYSGVATSQPLTATDLLSMSVALLCVRVL